MPEGSCQKWSRGGWLGAQLGGSVWLLVGGLLAVSRNLSAGIQMCFLFLIVNAVALLLWRWRRELSFGTGLEALLALLAVGSIVGVYVLDRAGVYESIQRGGIISARATYGLIVIVVVGLMAFVHLRFRAR